ncbi:HNH endonuclease with NUMOD4 motif [Fadolivirus algeromassiliense]|jgi:hypothetical protein|uniref:HNH endonuclease with NUMOD4 motif n=1 Tax=Fadolivirus FV1/VV64 TaxID=3070911 RepID=A0A7D3QU21_9VIRU|nr:HNH endonuclease with NUMOD4 motif [Fadolivirus algeromassiliense]QKF93807.1 HNH endonuclease with NUMOD4 motif [Fadolivirus FV1/VV64]
MNEIIESIEKELAKDICNIGWKQYCDFLVENNIELWKQIEKFPDYQISTMGRVRVVKSNRVGRENKVSIMKPSPRGNYLQVTLKNDIVRKSINLHTIVAKIFIPNSKPDNYKYVDHIDRDGTNNKINNLRWCTHQENMDYYKETIEYKGKKIYQYDLDNNLVKEWNDIREILEVHPEYKRDSMYKMLAGQMEKLYDYVWKYDDKDDIKLAEDEVFKKIGMYNEMDFSNFEVSNYGNVRNISRNNILNGKTNTFGYKEVCLYDNITKNSKYIKIHNLVAIHFIGNKPSDNHMVNHKDKNKLNNHYTNLEWLTNHENIAHAHGKKIRKLDIDTEEELAVYDSIIEACNENNLDGNKRIGVSKCCRGINKTAFGYKWEYVK